MNQNKLFSRFLRIPVIFTFALMSLAGIQPALATAHENGTSLYGESEVGFSLGEYLPGIAGLIDPWLTFVGGSGDEDAHSIAVDGSGNVYVTGVSNATWGSPVRAYTSGYDAFTPIDAFVAKLNSNGVLQWLTFLGSNGNDWGLGIAVDGGGNVYVTGQSSATWGSPVRAYTSGYDAFVAKLDSSSGALVWNTFLGSSGIDAGEGIAVDGSGNVYVTGSSDTNWGSPVRAHVAGYGYDAFAAKLDSSSGALVWNTFLGGSGMDHGGGIAVDGGGNVYVTGLSYATWGSPVRAYKSSTTEGFAAKLNSNGVLQWNTFLGSRGGDVGQDIAVDGSGNVYITGSSHAGADAFATKLNSNGVLQWNTPLGGSGDDQAFGIALDGGGNVYVTGVSYATWGSPVRAYKSGADAFATKLNSNGVLQWNTFLGSNDVDYGYEIALDGSGNVYIVGMSNATWGSPVMVYTAKNDIFHSGNDAFVAKLNSNGSIDPATLTTLTINTAGQGTVTGAGPFASGTVVSVSATPASGWQFVNWTGDAVANSSSASTTITMNGNKTITANFTINPKPRKK